MAKLQEKPTGEQVLGNQVLDTTGAPPAKIEPTPLPSVPEDSELASYANAGNEHVRIEDTKTPFLMLLQSGSPECKKSDAKYVQGAEEGMFMHGLTKTLYDGRLGVEAIDIFFDPQIIRWKPRGAAGGGGGFRGSFAAGDARLAELMKQAKPDEKNELTMNLPDGTQLVNSNQHYILYRPYVLPENVAAGELPRHDWTPAALALGSTQLKKSRELNALIGMEKVRNKDGLMVPIPRFGIVWRVTTVPEKNDKGSWFGVKFERLRRIDRDELYQAVPYHKFLAAGERRADLAEVVGREDSSGATNSSGGTPADGRSVI